MVVKESRQKHEVDGRLNLPSEMLPTVVESTQSREVMEELWTCCVFLVSLVFL